MPLTLRSTPTRDREERISHFLNSLITIIVLDQEHQHFIPLRPCLSPQGYHPIRHNMNIGYKFSHSKIVILYIGAFWSGYNETRILKTTRM